MTPIRAIVRSGAAWFLPLLFALACLFATRSTFRSGYSAGDIAQASVGLYVAAPLTAAFMAFQYRGFTNLLGPLRMRRPGLLVVLRAWWPLILGAPTTLCLAVLVTAGAVPNDLSSWLLITIDFVTVLSAALTGLACAWVFPSVVAVPMVSILWFVWIGYGPASTNLLVHNLASTFGCCSSDTRPAMVAVRGTLLLLLVISLGVGLLLASSRFVRFPRPLVATALTVLLVAGFASGVATLRTSGERLNLTATEARTTPLACDSEQGLEVCLWPENRARAAEVAAAVSQLNPKLQGLGMDTISRLTQANRGSDAVSVEAGQGISQEDLRLGIAVGYVALHSDCPAASGPARDQLTALVALLSGLQPEDVTARLGRQATTEAEQALARGQKSPEVVGAWFREGLRKVDCVPRR